MSVIGTPFVKHAGLSGSSKRVGGREYKVVYVVKTTAGDGAFIAGNAVGLPSRGATYVLPDNPSEVDTGATLFDIDPQSVGNNNSGHTIWDVTCTYSAKGVGNSGDPSFEIDNPILRPVKKNWSTANYIHYLAEDLDANAIDNSAGLLFEPNPIEETVVVLNATKSEAAFDPYSKGLGIYGFDIEAAEDYQNSVNNAVFATRPAGRALCKSIRATEEYESGIAYMNVTYTFHFRKPDKNVSDANTWQLRLQDKGPYYIEGGLPAGTKKFHTIEGTATTVDVKLNGVNGDKIDDDVAPNYLDFRTRRATNFGNFGLGF